jgi:hypothetical protein
MHGSRWLVVWSFVLFLLMVPQAVAQAPLIPPDIQAIMQKMQSGQQPTADEMRRLQEWGQAMQQQMKGGGATGGAAGGGGAAGAGAGSVGQNFGVTPVPSAGNPLQLPCPPSAGLDFPAGAPSKTEYLALLASLVDSYGKRLSGSKSDLDRVLASYAGDGSSVTGMGVTLYLSGAAAAAVYTDAIAALHNPDNLQAANNLGVALDTIPDSKAAAQVFQYVRSLAPKAPLPALNLGWAYFNGGRGDLAQKQFQEAGSLGPNLPGPDAGLGMLASCGGDQRTARMEFLKSLTKGFSAVVAFGYQQADQAEKQTESANTAPTPPPADNPDTGPIPELPVDADPEATAASEPAFQHAVTVANQRAPAATQRLQQAMSRVQSVSRNASVDANGEVTFPRVFDKQLFILREMNALVMAPVVGAEKSLLPQATNAMQSATQSLNNPDVQRLLELGKERDQANKRQQECVKPHVDKNGVPPTKEDADYVLNVCDAQYFAELKRIGDEEEQINFRQCKLQKSALDVIYSQNYKLWKAYSDSLRVAARDYYAFSQPVIDEIWDPDLNEVMQASREVQVVTLYQPAAQGALTLAGTARSFRELKCVAPPPPQPPKTARDPELTDKPSKCPLDPPLKLGPFEFGCHSLKIEGGEGLKIKFEHDFAKKETALWVGAGLDLEAAASLKNFSELKGAGETWAPPSPGIHGEVGMGVRFTDAGAVQDVNITSSASIEIGPASASISSGVSLENGPNFAARAGASSPQ